ncbi:MAG: hypothetical protein COT81_00115 [Candidatus Buchananbacteria bacterium CG10_big_fil_rev_8_21_14_0_10_42_9]|uniref:Uncharacterized protein n=1 Tax=Candidatus Buchananbacteria bacterium CG10_big_fil_rev_8_21_14_0_10_42_9 TaxID=1974526 RepID=A0A2H0W2R8_9BACT|nr:MAG: hypothetical protein COT81_00115 [Candidatus Buchananbacteria bacterium CG10_big_fil_rev_8_21_14_0_10_42_9]
MTFGEKGVSPADVNFTIDNVNSEAPEADFLVYAKELISMQNADQEIRAAKKWGESVEKVDQGNVAKLKEIIKQIGWPTISKVGQEASNAAFIIVQHADFDRNFQGEALQMMLKARSEDNEDVDGDNIARLTDRILVGESDDNNEQPEQLYGTQHDSNGNLIPIKDQANVDARRSELGMPPLEEEEAAFQEFIKRQ